MHAYSCSYVTEVAIRFLHVHYCWIIALTQNSQLRISGNMYASNYFSGRFSTLNLQTIHNERGQNNEQPDSFILFNSSVTADGCMSSFHTLSSAVK